MKKETKKPDIPIEEISKKDNDVAQLQDDVSRHESSLRSQKRVLDWTFGFIIAILIICFIGFVTFLIDAWRFQGQAYRGFQDTINLYYQNQGCTK